MKLAPIYPIGLCALLVACSPKPPSAAAIHEALSASVKKDSPEATIEVTGADWNQRSKYVTVNFNCMNCTRQYAGQEKETVPLGKGTVVIGLDNGKWNYDHATVRYDDGGMSDIADQHTF
jgi:hypothetical protein